MNDPDNLMIVDTGTRAYVVPTDEIRLALYFRGWVVLGIDIDSDVHTITHNEDETDVLNCHIAEIRNATEEDLATLPALKKVSNRLWNLTSSIDFENIDDIDPKHEEA